MPAVTAHDSFLRPLAGKAVCLCALVLLGTLARAGDSLPAHYREWLDRDVVYIITHEEREAFLKLASDADRDKFIERFWEVRNPSPGAPSNEFKEEHYRRLAYANQYFGNETGTPGWRTDRGRVYIELGEPQQKAVYLGYNKLRPMEIWFYQNSNPALPPYFYVVFYKADITSDFRLYSPYMDGPEKLVTTDPGSRVSSLKVIEEQAGREVARTALSLLPDEPVDFDTARTSLQSDLVISAIKTLPDQPLYKEQLKRRRELLESVTHRVVLGGEFLDVLTMPLRDDNGTVNLHYVLRQQRPEDFAVAQGKGDRYYSIEVRARVFGPGNKLIFTQADSLAQYLSETQFQRIRDKALSYEGWLPLPPGRYRIEFLLTNKLKQTGFRAERDIVVPAPPGDGIALIGPVALSGIEQVGGMQGRFLPFSVAGVRFEPNAAQNTDLVSGEDLQVFYQLWERPADPNSNRGKKLIVEYAYGRPGVPRDAKVIRDEIDRDQFDPSGSMLSGKKISLFNLAPGNYRLAVTVTDPDSQRKVFGALNFRVTRDAPVRSWHLYNENTGDLVSGGAADYHRALCYLATGDRPNAQKWLKTAFEKNPKDALIIPKLVDLYFADQSFTAIADLYTRAGIDGHSDESTLLRTAESLDRTGRTREAIALLESALAVHAGSGPLHLALSAYYKRAGDVHKAEEMERKGKLLMASSPGNKQQP